MKVKSLIMVTCIMACLPRICTALLCYRCDSDFEKDCEFYPAPISVYEDCNDKVTHIGERAQVNETNNQQAIYVRYRYRACPVLETTVKQFVPLNSNPVEGSNFICGKAVTTSKNGIRIRRGCTPDLFLYGTDACVSKHPNLGKDLACFCATDLCNHGLPRSSSNHNAFIVFLFSGLAYLTN